LADVVLKRRCKLLSFFYNNQNKTETRKANEQTTEAAVTQPLLHSYYIIVKIANKIVKCHVDTGSITSIINLKLGRELNLHPEPVSQGESKVFSTSTTPMPSSYRCQNKIFWSLYLSYCKGGW